MSSSRILIVNADDFGQSEGINRGIAECFERGIVTSASLMVYGAAARGAVEYAALHPGLALGIHLDLGEWVHRDGAWLRHRGVVDLDDRVAVLDEMERQVARFVAMAGAPPTHVDSHQHVHRNAPARDIAESIAGRLRVPLREAASGIRHCGSFYGQDAEGRSYPDAIGVEALRNLLSRLEPGTTELACHPGYANDVDTTYRDERAVEVRTLCDARVRETLVEQRIELRSFATYAESAAMQSLSPGAPPR